MPQARFPPDYFPLIWETVYRFTDSIFRMINVLTIKGQQMIYICVAMTQAACSSD